MNWLDKMERKYGRYAIKNLALYIVAMQIIGFSLIFLDIFSYGEMALSPFHITDYKEYYRLFTFLLVPATRSIIFFAFVMYFYYLIGSSLEANWGTLKFNLYYLIGILGTIAGAFIANTEVDTWYINLSLFLAFATLFPNFEVRLYFLLPIKIKYLAYLNVGFFIFELITGSNKSRVAIVVIMLNYLLFFGKRVITKKKAHTRKKQYKKKLQVKKDYFHKCTVCGKTEKDDENLEFRYCSKCNGTYEYCSNHLFTHEHKK